MKIELPMYIVNGGDGSAWAQICKTFEDAEAIEEQDPWSDGWAEPSATIVYIEVDEQGKIISGAVTLEEQKKEWAEDEV